MRTTVGSSPRACASLPVRPARPSSRGDGGAASRARWAGARGPRARAPSVREVQREQDGGREHPREVERAERQRDAGVGARRVPAPASEPARPTTGQMPPGMYLPISPTKYQVTQANMGASMPTSARAWRQRSASRPSPEPPRGGRPPAMRAGHRRWTSARCPTGGRSPGPRTRPRPPRSRCRPRWSPRQAFPLQSVSPPSARSGRKSRLGLGDVAVPTLG